MNVNSRGNFIIECKYIVKDVPYGDSGYCKKIEQYVSTAASGITMIRCRGCLSDCNYKSAEQVRAEANYETFSEYARKQAKKDARMAGKIISGAGRITGRAISSTGKVVGTVVSETVQEEKEKFLFRRMAVKELRKGWKEEKDREIQYKSTHKIIESKYAVVGKSLSISGLLCFLYALVLVFINSHSYSLYTNGQWGIVLGMWYVLMAVGTIMKTDELDLITGQRNKLGIRKAVPCFVLFILFLLLDIVKIKKSTYMLKEHILMRILPELVIILLTFIAFKSKYNTNNQS